VVKRRTDSVAAESRGTNDADFISTPGRVATSRRVTDLLMHAPRATTCFGTQIMQYANFFPLGRKMHAFKWAENRTRRHIKGGMILAKKK